MRFTDNSRVTEPLYREHWLDIDAERFERYKSMFRWSAVTESLIARADVRTGHVVVDVGCGPGFAAVELAKRVGVTGHVHAIDINREFVEHAKRVAKEERLTETSSHERDGLSRRPGVDVRRVRRALKPGGIAHAVDSDWGLTLAEPVPEKLWAELMCAVAPGFRTPNIGRRLYGYAKAAGFSAIDVAVISNPDTNGRLLPMVRGLCSRARRSSAMPADRIAEIERILEDPLKQGTLLIVNPQFVVTARV
jgi:SAM-dependent methyltransferase